MEYLKDLMKERTNSKFYIISSFFFFAIAFSRIAISIIKNNPISIYDWVYVILFFIGGLTYLLVGLGYLTSLLLGKAFIVIDDQFIRIKTDTFDKEQSVEWNDISAINYKPGVFVITKKDQSIIKLTITKLEYSIVQEVKNVIVEIAGSKKLEINI